MILILILFLLACYFLKKKNIFLHSDTYIILKGKKKQKNFQKRILED